MNKLYVKTFEVVKRHKQGIEVRITADIADYIYHTYSQIVFDPIHRINKAVTMGFYVHIHSIANPDIILLDTATDIVHKNTITFNVLVDSMDNVYIGQPISNYSIEVHQLC